MLQIDVAKARWQATDNYWGIFFGQMWLIFEGCGDARMTELVGISPLTHVSIVKREMNRPQKKIKDFSCFGRFGW